MVKTSPKTILAISLMLVPLILTVVYERSLAHQGPEISSIAILTPIVHGMDSEASLAGDVQQKLTAELTAVGGLKVEAGSGNDPEKAGKDLGVDAVLVTSVIVDSGIIQLSVKVIDPRTNEVLWNTPYEGRRDSYPQMIRAVGETLQQNLRLK